MATESQSFPKLPSSVWWSFRKKLHQSLPKEVTIQYLQTALGLGPAAAKTYLNPLKRLGLVGDDGKVTDRGIKWRGEQKDYEEACAEIVADIYPDELNDAISNPSDEKDRIVRWFMNRLRIGNDAANHMTSIYVLIREADLSKEPDTNAPTKAKGDSKPNGKKSSPTTQPKAESTTSSVAPSATSNSRNENQRGFQPKIHIDVQIHISPESTPEQIDQIFASMAKHLPNLSS